MIETLLLLLGFAIGAPAGWAAHDALTPDADDPVRAELEFCRNDRMILPQGDDLASLKVLDHTKPENADRLLKMSRGEIEPPLGNRLAKVINKHDELHERLCPEPSSIRASSP